MSSIRGNVHQRAVDASVIFAKDETFMADIEDIMLSGENVKRSAITLLADIERIISPEQLASFPIVGSKEGKGVNNWDEYVSVLDGKQVKSSFYQDLADSLPLSVANRRNLELMREYAKPGWKQGEGLLDPEGWPEPGAATTSRIRLYEQRQSNIRNMVKKAFKTMQTIKKIQDECSGVVCKILPGEQAGTKYSRSTLPIYIKDKVYEDQSAVWSTATLLQLASMHHDAKGEPTGRTKLDVAIANGGTLKAINDVLKREREDGNGKGNDTNAAKVTAFNIENAEQVATVANIFASYFFKDVEKGTLDLDHYNKVLKLTQTDDETVIVIEKLAELFEDLRSKTERRYADIAAKQLAGETKVA